MNRSVQLPVRGALATARVANRLHRSNMAARLADARELREEARALRAEALLTRRTAQVRRGG